MIKFLVVIINIAVSQYLFLEFIGLSQAIGGGLAIPGMSPLVRLGHVQRPRADHLGHVAEATAAPRCSRHNLYATHQLSQNSRTVANSAAAVPIFIITYQKIAILERYGQVLITTCKWYHILIASILLLHSVEASVSQKIVFYK